MAHKAGVLRWLEGRYGVLSVAGLALTTTPSIEASPKVSKLVRADRAAAFHRKLDVEADLPPLPAGEGKVAALASRWRSGATRAPERRIRHDQPAPGAADWLKSDKCQVARPSLPTCDKERFISVISRSLTKIGNAYARRLRRRRIADPSGGPAT